MKERIYISAIISLMAATIFTGYQWYDSHQREVERKEFHDANRIHHLSSHMLLFSLAIEEENFEAFHRALNAAQRYTILYDDESVELVEHLLDLLSDVRESLGNQENVEDLHLIASLLEEIEERDDQVIFENEGSSVEGARQLLREYETALEEM